MVDKDRQFESKLRTTLLVLASVVICGTTVWALIVVGTPKQARMREFDEARVTDLRYIKNAIENFARTNGELPDELAQLNLAPDDLLDPETKVEYGYSPLGTRNYQLSARFHFPDHENYQWYDEDWSHEAGEHEFSFEIPGLDAKPDDTVRLLSTSS